RPPSCTIASNSASGVGPTVSSVPSYSSTRSETTLSTVLPASSECVPHELLPIIPPSVQRLCVEGSGPNVRRCSSARLLSVSSTTPGCTRANRLSASSSRMAFMHLVKSSTTATLQHWPARLVPAPRDNT